MLDLLLLFFFFFFSLLLLRCCCYYSSLEVRRRRRRKKKYESSKMHSSLHSHIYSNLCALNHFLQRSNQLHLLLPDCPCELQTFCSQNKATQWKRLHLSRRWIVFVRWIGYASAITSKVQLIYWLRFMLEFVPILFYLFIALSYYLGAHSL